MNEEVLNATVRKFLKKVGITSQREIELAVRDAVANGRLKGDESLLAKSRKPEDGLRDRWSRDYRSIRAETDKRAAPLSAEDQVVQSMPDASPTKWHRAHTTWFFEQFLLQPHHAQYRRFDERFGYLFNSYYVAVGPRHARPQRGLVTRPGVEEITAYRAHVDAAVAQLIGTGDDETLRKMIAHRGDRAASRAAAAGIDHHRHPACPRAKSDASGL